MLKFIHNLNHLQMRYLRDHCDVGWNRGQTLIHQDCRYFKGDMPCNFHKLEGVHCNHCPHYDTINEKVLIIKLGAIGDVIRTTPLLRKIKNVYPKAHLTWLTDYPEVIPSLVDDTLSLDLKNILYLLSVSFDIAYNLDKDREAIALFSMIKADIKEGFTLDERGKCYPINEKASYKWLTGLFDDINKANKKSYLEEIFDICGFEYHNEEYILDLSHSPKWEIPEPNPLIGFNTGCGNRWTTRNWKDDNWITLARFLKQQGYGIILFGGKNEDKKNKEISQKAGVTYLGYFPLKQFISLVNQCDLIVTGVTMALHIAIGLNKKLVLLNNIFNKHEFELYGLGEIIEPDIDCKGCFRSSCNTECMEMVKPEWVSSAVERLLQ